MVTNQLTLKKPLSTSELIKLNSIEFISGNKNVSAANISSNLHWNSESLIFVSEEKILNSGSLNDFAILILSFKPDDLYLKNIDLTKSAILRCNNISKTIGEILALVANQFEPQSQTGVSSHASIHPSAKIDPSATIGAFSVIAENVEVGANVQISSNCTLGPEVKIGSHTKLHPGVRIGSRCLIGENCEIHSNTVIGSDGFGYVPLPDKTFRKIPQLGIVRIGNNVEIGANCAIDRATFLETVIENGCKLDNLIHIAHNCKVGSNSRLTAGFMLAGSSSIGANFLSGGGALVADHVTICDNVTLGGKSGVTNDITEPGAYAGFPIQPMREALKTLASISKLVELRKDVAELKKLMQKNGTLNSKVKE